MQHRCSSCCMLYTINLFSNGRQTIRRFHGTEMSSTTTTSAHSLDIHDPTSAAYKKARRRHLKTTRNRSDQTDAEWTAFRAAEKKYKARFPPPDLSSVLDLALLDDERAEEVSRGVWKGGIDASSYREIGLKNGESSSGRRKAYVFPDRPGA